MKLETTTQAGYAIHVAHLAGGCDEISITSPWGVVLAKVVGHTYRATVNASPGVYNKPKEATK